MIKRLSIKGLADFMTASASRQRSLLRAYKYPKEDESRAKILYYREARDRVAVYRQSRPPPELARHASDWARTARREQFGSSAHSVEE
jgi:hypothetical protein